MDALSSSVNPRKMPTINTKYVASNRHLVKDRPGSAFFMQSQSPLKSTTSIKQITQVSSETSQPVNRLLNWLDSKINTFIDPPIQPWIDPRLVLSDNFAPVDELPPTECQVTFGSMPSCLDGGAYMRVGPNPQFLPAGPHHFFDGDGMVHCFRITEGGNRATISSRYIQTYKFTVERQAGVSVFPNLFSGFNGLPAFISRGFLAAARVAFGQYNPQNGIGLANTSLALIGGRLYALCESDLPYEIQVTSNGDVLTLGRQDFNGKLSMNMTAHPKLDPNTGEVFAFRYGPLQPFLTLFRFDKFGNKSADVPVFSMNRPSLLHDFAVTGKFAIFTDTQFVVDLAGMVFGGSGSPIRVDQMKVPRLGLIPKHANDGRQMKWFDVPGFNNLHAINAWDEVDEFGNESITLVAPNIHSPEHFMKRMELIRTSVERVRIDLSKGTVSRTSLPAATNLEFGVINPAYLGRKNRFIYAASGGTNLNMAGVVKLDLEAEGKQHRSVVVAMRPYGEDCYGGEVLFVAREPDNKEADEDDGYLLSYVHDERKQESSFIVMDAKSSDLEIVAKVALPHRVPYGLHGLFLREKDLVT